MTQCTRYKLINDIDSAVTETLKGFVLTNPNIIMLDFGNVVAVKDYAQAQKVQIVSGGGAGHEPAYAGYVGKGILTAAIHGEIYTSPSASDILRLLRELSFKNNRGILLIIQNNSGERLHFGLAVERAKNEAIRVKTIVVDDDCYFIKSWKGRRGLSGIVLLQKIAGAMSETEMELDEIHSFCQEVQKQMVSISVSLQSSTPTRSSLCVCPRYAKDNAVEVGVSLNGEPGMRKDLKTAAEVCNFILKEITSSDVSNPIELQPEMPLVLLLNNLGAITKMEELILLQELLRQLYQRDVQVVRVYYGKFVTALDTAGFSVTFLKVFDEKITTYLDAVCNVPAWGKVNEFEISPKLDRTICSKVKPEQLPVPQAGPRLTERESNTLMMILQFACDALYSCEKQLNTIDMEMGDGDTGTRIRRGMEAIDGSIKNSSLDLAFPFNLFHQLSVLIEKNFEGALGLIYSVFFEAASNTFRRIPDSERIDAKLWLAALKAGNIAVKKYTKAEAGYRTIYDPLYVCATLLEGGLSRDISVIEAVDVAVSAAEEAAQNTKRPFSKYPDPGAHSVAIWMRAAFEGLKCRWTDSE